MEERDLNCSEEKSYYPIMADFATKVTKILYYQHTRGIKLRNVFDTHAVVVISISQLTKHRVTLFYDVVLTRFFAASRLKHISGNA